MQDVFTYLSAARYCLHIVKLDARNPEFLHENVEGFDPHDRGAGNLIPVDDDSAISPIFGQFRIEVNEFFGQDIQGIVDRDYFNLKNERNYPLTMIAS